MDRLDLEGSFRALAYLPGRRQWHSTPVLLPGKSHERRSLVGYSPWGRWESDTTEQRHFHFSLSCTGEGNGNPLQCSCLENPRDGEAWWSAVYGVAQSRTRLKQLSSSSSNLSPPPPKRQEKQPFLFFKFLAALSLYCCAQAFSSCGDWGRLSGCGPQASLVAGPGL